MSTALGRSAARSGLAGTPLDEQYNSIALHYVSNGLMKEQTGHLPHFLQFVKADVLCGKMTPRT